MLNKKRFFVLLALLPLMLAGRAVLAADAGEKLTDEARCYACHQMSEPLLAPPWLAIAARHAPNKQLMLDVLARKIVRGGGGNWGDVPMPPNQQVNIEEARAIAAWILNLPPKK